MGPHSHHRSLCVEQPFPEPKGNVSPECNMLVLTGMYGSAKTERKYLWPLSFTRSAWHDWGERHRRRGSAKGRHGLVTTGPLGSVPWVALRDHGVGASAVI